MFGVTRACSVSPRSSPMSATTTSPAWNRPGAALPVPSGRRHMSAPDPPAPAVGAFPAARHEPAGVGIAPHRLLGDRAPGARHHLLDVVPRLCRLHLRAGVERLSHP